MANNLTMEELLQARTKGYGEAIVIPDINADHFKIKTNLLQLVQANPYHGFERENPHTHINNFKRITSTLKFRDMPNDVIKLMMFPYSLEGAARVWENASKTDDRIDKLADQISTLVDIFAKKVVTLATVKAVEEYCVTCGCNHGQYNYDATNSNQSSVCATTGEFKNEIQNTMKTQQTVLMEQQNAFQNNLQNMLSGFFQNQASTSGTLPSNTIPNLKGKMKEITTHSGVAYEGPWIPTKLSPKKVVERETKETTEKEQTNFQGSIGHIRPPVVPIPEPDVSKTLPKLKIPSPSRLNDQKLHKKATNQMEKFFQIFQDLNFDISFTDALLLIPKFAYMINSLLANKDKCMSRLGRSWREHKSYALSIWKKLSLPELTPTQMTLKLADRSIIRPKGVAEDIFVKVGKFHFLTDFVVIDFEADPRVPLILGRSILRTDRALIDVYGEEITFREMLGFSNNSSGGNPTSTSDPIISDSSLSLTPFEGIDFILEEIATYLKDESISPKIDHVDFKAKSLIKEPPDLELKDLPSHLEYAYLEGVDKLPMIIAKDLKEDEKEAILEVLKAHKRAIAWKITDIKGIDPRFCTHKILIKEDYKAAVQSQRRVNPKIHEVIKKEVIKLLDAKMIYSISDSPWVSPFHCVPKKGGITVVDIENNELIPTRLVTDFSKIARPMTHLLEKETPFVFSKDCIDDFETLKKNLTKASILVVPDWNLPFELMCDASDFAIGTVLGQSKAFPTNDARVVVKFLKSLFARFGTPRAIISDPWTHFCNDKFAKVMSKYGVTHHLATTYHPQTSGQVKESNCGLKRILERTVGENGVSWSKKLEDALWAFRTAYKTPIECTPYKLVYGKSCHLPIELEHKAYWALKHVNFDLKTAGDHRKLQLNELRDQAYENSLIYKEKTKKLHDSKIKNRIFNVCDRVLLFNSHLKIFLGKLITRWSGPITITKVFPYGTVELSQPEGPNFKVSGHRVKHYFGGDIPQLVVPDLQTFPMDK
uniref:Reverse transcriptase domain-containing protein n=1 Tax=Tanacetum cinerariifolium TaxID=118510 RepID=A0A6L2LRQ8_TANCI|nr:reverse transcriptase domain-containing protein [Tanacetum cinerariifolium]